jgi:PKD repeat protein
MRIPAPFRTSSSAERSRGQSLVEFAMTLPVILGLTLIALDFGRVYLGYINVQNMTRVAANFAANNPDAWGAKPDAKVQTQYRNQILADATSTNCALPTAGGSPVVPAPVFTDATGDGSIGLGDRVRVQLDCTFDVITPFVSALVGGRVRVSAESNFSVKSGMSLVKPEPIVVPLPVAAFIANDTTLAPDPLTVLGSNSIVTFRDTSGGGPTIWNWDFGDGTPPMATQDPVHEFACALPSCSYVVELTATNVSGDSTATMSVTVIGTSLVDFASTSPTGQVPWTVTFTDTSVPGGTNPTWDFGDGNTGTGATVAHTYNSTAGSPFSVSLTVTYPDPTGTQTTTKSGYVTLSAKLCTVPYLSGHRFNDAQGIWQGPPNNFTGNVLRGPGAPTGNFSITAQSLTGGDVVSCTSNIEVSRP